MAAGCATTRASRAASCTNTGTLPATSLTGQLSRASMLCHNLCSKNEACVMSRNSGRNTDGTFAPGNPGKPRGARHRATHATLALLDGELEALTRQAVAMALNGDATALRLCLDRIAPPKRDAPVEFDLPPMKSAQDAAQAAGAVLGAVASGDLTPTGSRARNGSDRDLPAHARNDRDWGARGGAGRGAAMTLDGASHGSKAPPRLWMLARTWHSRERLARLLARLEAAVLASGDALLRPCRRLAHGTDSAPLPSRRRRASRSPARACGGLLAVRTPQSGGPVRRGLSLRKPSNGR